MAKYLLWKNCQEFGCERWYGFDGQLAFYGWLCKQGYDRAIVDYELRIEQPFETLDIKDHEKLLIEIAMAEADGIKTQAAKLLGITRTTLSEKIKRHETSKN